MVRNVGVQRYFQRTYRYNAYNQGVKDKITEMTLNNSGVRDIGRVLKISNNTVISVLKKTLKSTLIFWTRKSPNASFS